VEDEPRKSVRSHDPATEEASHGSQLDERSPGGGWRARCSLRSDLLSSPAVPESLGLVGSRIGCSARNCSRAGTRAGAAGYVADRYWPGWLLAAVVVAGSAADVQAARASPTTSSPAAPEKTLTSSRLGPFVAFAWVHVSVFPLIDPGRVVEDMLVGDTAIPSSDHPVVNARGCWICARGVSGAW
jgi:hypothetical protein